MRKKLFQSHELVGVYIVELSSLLVKSSLNV